MKQLPSFKCIVAACASCETSCTGEERKSWDVGRFVKTVAFFNKPPSPGELLSAIINQPAKILSALTGDSTEVRPCFVCQPQQKWTP